MRELVCLEDSSLACARDVVYGCIDESSAEVHRIAQPAGRLSSCIGIELRSRFSQLEVRRRLGLKGSDVRPQATFGLSPRASGCLDAVRGLYGVRSACPGHESLGNMSESECVLEGAPAAGPVVDPTRWLHSRLERLAGYAGAAFTRDWRVAAPQVSGDKMMWSWIGAL